jgi:hypothetical protein
MESFRRDVAQDDALGIADAKRDGLNGLPPRDETHTGDRLGMSHPGAECHPSAVNREQFQRLRASLGGNLDDRARARAALGREPGGQAADAVARDLRVAAVRIEAPSGVDV